LYYDFYDYVDHLEDADHNKVAASLLKSCQDTLLSLIRSTAHTDSLYTALRKGNNFIIVKNYCGIATSDPSINSVALKGKEKTDWWKATH
jgi:predicted nucleic acid-binding Zn finger protein